MSEIISVMIDIETLGITPGCKIVSIGAVAFSGDELLGHEFYVRINRYLGQDNYFEEEDTVRWWASQSEEVRKEIDPSHNPETVISIYNALRQLNNFLTELAMSCDVKIEDIEIWCKGASFDFPILKRAYQLEGIIYFWNFRKERCFRTLQGLFPNLSESVKPELSGGIKHHALYDATEQALHAAYILGALDNGY
jgi:hypothetical protein